MLSSVVNDALTPIAKGVHGNVPTVDGLSGSEVSNVAYWFQLRIRNALDGRGYSHPQHSSTLARDLASSVHRSIEFAAEHEEASDPHKAHYLVAHGPQLIDTLVTPEVAAAVRYYFVLAQAFTDSKYVGESGPEFFPAGRRIERAGALFYGVDGDNGSSPANDPARRTANVTRPLGEQLQALESSGRFTPTERQWLISIAERAESRIVPGTTHRSTRLRLFAGSITTELMSDVNKRPRPLHDPRHGRRVLQRLSEMCAALVPDGDVGAFRSAMEWEIADRFRIADNSTLTTVSDHLDNAGVTYALVPSLVAQSRSEGEAGDRSEYLVVIAGSPTEVADQLFLPNTGIVERFFAMPDSSTTYAAPVLSGRVTTQDPHTGETVTAHVMPVSPEAFESIAIPCGDTHVITASTVLDGQLANPRAMDQFRGPVGTVTVVDFRATPTPAIAR